MWRYRDNALEISETKYPTSQIAALSVVSNSLAVMSVSQTGVTNTFAYDALNRQIAANNGRGNTTQTIYDEHGRVASTIDALGYATTYGYDALGRRVSTTDPLTNTVYTAYDAQGRVVSQRGATYPVDYAYDEFGEKIAMTTYRDLSGERETGNGEPVSGALQGDVTQWLRDEATGFVTNKVYADGKGPSYTYTPDGKLATRTWARGIVTTYSYDDIGSLTNTVYSDSTPTILLAYNRAGRQVQAIDAAGVTTFEYNDYGHRIEITRCGSAMSETRTDYYGYNERGELISAAKNARCAENVEYAYEYDDIGNRITSFDIGTNRTYIANNLNQYASISNLFASASLREEFLPQFDADGNQTLIQTATGMWQVQYNGENRPVRWENVSTNSSTPDSSTPTLLSMSFDRMSRRVTKNSQRFVYDGYLQVANFELSNANSQLTTHNSQLFIWDPTEPVATRPLVFNYATALPAYYTHSERAKWTKFLKRGMILFL